MEIFKTSLSGVLILEPKVFHDERGFFLESYNNIAMWEAGIKDSFVQDNHSFSVRNTIRGLHYQLHQPQGKLVRAVRGEIHDVVVDLRWQSSTFGKHYTAFLSEHNHRMLWVPEGFAHGYEVLSDVADVVYKTTQYYAPGDERTIVWNDPDLGIPWLSENPLISVKDALGRPFLSAEVYDEENT